MSGSRPFPLLVSVGATAAATAAAACSPESSCSTLGPRPRGAGMHCSCCGSSSWRPNGWRFPAASWTISAGTVAPRAASAPCRPLLFFLPPSQFRRPRRPPRLLSLSTSLSRLSRPASAPFPCRLLSPTTPTFFFRCCLPVSHALSSISPLAALGFPHFLSYSTSLLSRKRSSFAKAWVLGILGAAPPPPVAFSD